MRPLERLVVGAFGLLPVGLRDTLVAYSMGELVTRDPRLHRREVPTITVGELLDAMKVRR